MNINEKIDYLFSKINWKDSALDAKAIDIMNTIKEDIGQKEIGNGKSYEDVGIKAVVHFGMSTQIDKIQEECMKLALALHQYKCETNTGKSKDQVYEKLADVKIMMMQADFIFCSVRIDENIKNKLERLDLIIK